MNKDNCIFCKMVAGEVATTKIYEDEVVLAFLDIGPIREKIDSASKRSYLFHPGRHLGRDSFGIVG